MDIIIFKIYGITKINKEFEGGSEFCDIKTLFYNGKLLKNNTYVCVGEASKDSFNASKVFPYESITGEIKQIKALKGKIKDLTIKTEDNKNLNVVTNYFRTEKNKKSIFKGYALKDKFVALKIYPLQTLDVIIKTEPLSCVFNSALKECTVEIHDNYQNSVKFNKFKIRGVLELVYVNDDIALTGYFEETKYGVCFNVIKHNKNISSGENLIKAYLEKQFPNNKIISKRSISKIVSTFGVKTLDVIENNPAEIKEILPKKMSEENLEKFRDRVIMSQFIQELYFFCDAENIDARIANKIYDTYGLASIKVLKENPYLLVNIDSELFAQADMLAKTNKINFNDDLRLKSAIKYFLYQDSKENGNVYTDIDVLYKGLNRFLNLVGSYDSHLVIDKDEIDNILDKEQSEGLIYREDNKVYLKYNYVYEVFIAKKIKELLSDFKMPFTDTLKIDKAIADFNKKTKLASKQQDAIRNALLNNISILTGGPGTGKTLTVRAIISCIKTINPYAKFKLAAPTGRASQRLAEVTNEPATTIHKLLNINFYQTIDMEIEKPADMEDLDFLIIDEFSMVDIELFYKLLKCLDEKTRIIIIGDYNQLASVNPGQLLKDLVDSKKIKTTRLTEVFRQDKESLIIEVAVAINESKPIDFKKLESNEDDFLDKDFSFIEAQTLDEIDEILMSILNKLKAQGKTFKDLQILCPTNKGDIGTIKINEDIQKNFNDSENIQQLNMISVLKENDKVIQTVNDYDLKVMNGSIGFIDKINPCINDEICIDISYDDIEVTYDLKTIDEIKLAYAVTIHKSQGSEFPIVIIPIHKNQTNVLNLNLLYTGITRAKAHVIIIGDKQTFLNSLEKNETNRNSGLVDRL